MSDHERGGPRQPLPETSDELEVELDEWDRMFDSLVLDEVPEAQSASAADDGWPDPPTAETGDALGNLVSGGSVELAGEPEALGGLLGSGAPAPAPAREVRPTRIDPDNDDSGLLTSAPRVEARPPPRRHPTIVRREDLERMREERAQAKASQAAAIPRRPEVQPADPVDVPTASVNASDLDRMVAAAEAKAGQAAAAFFEDEDDDDLYLDEFYADIEVGGERTSDPQIAPARERPPSEPVSERRVSRHVVRRETLGDRDDRPPTTPPPAAIEVTADLPDDDATSFEMAPVAPSLDATSTGDGDSGDGGIQMTADLPDDDATSFEMAPVAPSLDATSTGDGDSDDGGIHITADL
ncbi:MAG TPA: hypothetical protein VFG83_13175, partial [Kofleriaceae bacterium]|nr:hypothetical protein [Kofleriaceae bacterium]